MKRSFEKPILALLSKRVLQSLRIDHPTLLLSFIENILQSNLKTLNLKSSSVFENDIEIIKENFSHLQTGSIDVKVVHASDIRDTKFYTGANNQIHFSFVKDYGN